MDDNVPEVDVAGVSKLVLVILVLKNVLLINMSLNYVMIYLNKLTWKSLS